MLQPMLIGLSMAVISGGNHEIEYNIYFQIMHVILRKVEKGHGLLT